MECKYDNTDDVLCGIQAILIQGSSLKKISDFKKSYNFPYIDETIFLCF